VTGHLKVVKNDRKLSYRDGIGEVASTYELEGMKIVPYQRVVVRPPYGGAQKKELKMSFRSQRLLHPMLLLLPLYLSHSAFAQQHKAHVHGTSTLLVAVESDELVLEFTAPADDIVGFEHEPKNEEQEHQVEDALALLKSPSKLFALPEAADCEEEEVQVLAAMHDGEHEEDHKAKHDHHKKDDHAHDKKEDRAHDEKSSAKTSDRHDEDEETHSEFRLRYHFHCHAVGKLAGFELLMFKQFPRMHQVQVQVISARGQKSLTLDQDQPQLTF
jgi:hypothetical protein